MTSDRRPIIAANWKMHHDHLVAIQVVQKLSYRLEREDYDACEIVICPPFTDLRTLQTLFEADLRDPKPQVARARERRDANLR